MFSFQKLLLMYVYCFKKKWVCFWVKNFKLCIHFGSEIVKICSKKLWIWYIFEISVGPWHRNSTTHGTHHLYRVHSSHLHRRRDATRRHGLCRRNPGRIWKNLLLQPPHDGCFAQSQCANRDADRVPKRLHAVRRGAEGHAYLRRDADHSVRRSLRGRRRVSFWKFGKF